MKSRPKTGGGKYTSDPSFSYWTTRYVITEYFTKSSIKKINYNNNDQFTLAMKMPSFNDLSALDLKKDVVSIESVGGD